MVRLASVFTLAVAGLVAAAPIRLSKRAAFALQDYAAFQISDGTAGNAQAEANAVFVDPFNGVDLATVDATTLKAVQTMREAAEDAETSQFNPAIEAASGAAATALQNGKIKNKVLKLTGEVQGINIQIAQAKAAGKDTTKLTASLAAEQKKLTTNIGLDTKAAGQASQGVTGGAAAASTNEDATDASSSAAASSTKKAAASATKTAAAASSTAAAAASGSGVAFAVQDYADFQISDGTTGNAAAEANAVFVDPFAGVDLATLDDSVADNIETMRQAAESAETDDFNPAIAAASGDAATALQNGKIKNKVLKLTAEVQGLQIKLAKAQAAGSDTSSIESKIAAEQKKLTTNIATDTKNAGEASQGVA
ncbi:uncharacterized protein TRAVEDRAFT_150580 [Trametes versicolor FP-101664 SS1]|uniref:uncharacterized protein n=1 Tax=Trametes versicolor (strain FP-101664) TaxID=717944 RepID=UPI0004622CC8|nr:uncharacterized protein TRAVEDRAFT_150580 [Trametes versicolor FP-101664 SS1]EIW57929.1 hypothetical protein TRAVEDRAFT_150580 [Trametes versicolor FP-101664 SS1]